MTDWTPCYSRFATKLLMIIIERCWVQERKGKKGKKKSEFTRTLFDGDNQ